MGLLIPSPTLYHRQANVGGCAYRISSIKLNSKARSALMKFWLNKARVLLTLIPARLATFLTGYSTSRISAGVAPSSFFSPVEPKENALRDGEPLAGIGLVPFFSKKIGRLRTLRLVWVNV
jgi:hypothetical protein